MRKEEINMSIRDKINEKAKSSIPTIWVIESVKELKEHKEKISEEENDSYVQGRLDAIGIFNHTIDRIFGEKLT